MKKYIISILIGSIGLVAKSQCPGDVTNGYYFCGSMPRVTLNKYLNKSASMIGLSDQTYTALEWTTTQQAEDELMITNLKPKWLGRVAGSWWAGQNNDAEFAKADYVATFIHNIDTYIILQAAVFEHVDFSLQPTGTGSWSPILIPDYVLDEFAQTIEPRYFDADSMRYDDWATNDHHASDDSYVPDMSKIQTRMWFYYRATMYIERGYEAIHFGQFMIMNDMDPINVFWWDMLSKVRDYAANGKPVFGLNGARRGIVLCDAHLSGDGCDESAINDVPYLMSVYNPTMRTDQLLFDYVSFGLSPDETQSIHNPSSIYDDYDRLASINYSDCAMYGNGYGGNLPVDWGWTFAQSHPIPAIAEFDVGGTKEDKAIYQGEKTDQYYIHPDVSYLTWGFGGESIWFGLQSESYRNYFLAYSYMRSKELDGDVFCQIPLRRFLWFFPEPPIAWPGLPYRANEGYSNQEDVIKWIWGNDKYIEFCGLTTVTNDFTIGVTGWLTSAHIRTLADVNGDGMEDIVGFGESNVFVALSNGVSFNSPSIWYNNDFTHTFGWLVNDHVRRLGDFNGDGKLDIIGFDNDGTKVAVSNGAGFNTAYYANSLFGNDDGYNNVDHIREIGDFNGDGKIDFVICGDDETKIYKSTFGSFINTMHSSGINEFSKNSGWLTSKHLRLIGDVNGDGKDDIVGLKDDEVTVGLSTGNTFVTSIWLSDGLCYNDGWRIDKHPRVLADVNGDGMDDIVGFGYWGVRVALSTGSSFMEPEYWIYDYGYNPEVGGWNNTEHIRLLADVNGDGKDDIVGFGNIGTVVSLSTGSSFSKIEYTPHFGKDAAAGGWILNDHPRLVSDMDGDGRCELIGFGQYNVYLMNCVTSSETFKDANDITILDYDNKDSLTISLYPNPASDRVFLNVESQTINQINITDINGKEWTQRVNITAMGEYIEIDVTALLNGIYFLRIELENGNQFASGVIVAR